MSPNFSFDQLADMRVVQVSDRRYNQVLGRIRLPEIRPKKIGAEALDCLAGAENRPPKRMIFPESLGEELMDEVVRRVLDHLDLFDDDLLLPLDVVRRERRIADDVGEDVDARAAGARRAP